MEFDFNEAFGLVFGLATSCVLLGAFISRFTKTEKDDEIFERLKKALGIK